MKDCFLFYVDNDLFLSMIDYNKRMMEIPLNLTSLGVEEVLTRGNKRHYIVRPNVSVSTWSETNMFCLQTLNATSLTYFSQNELLELSNFIGKPSIIFSGFQRRNNVELHR